jgi:hypothetical protein
MMRTAALFVCVAALLADCATAPQGVTARSQLPGKWDWEKSEPHCGADAGAPVGWDLLMLNADTFCWRRTDWKAGACTALLKRCPT